MSRYRNVAIQAVTKHDRQQTVDSLREIIGECDGWIDDFQLFSNVSMMLRCTLPSYAAEKFANRLTALGLKLGTDDENALSQFTDGESKEDEFSCVLNVTFFHDERDLRRHVPAVPG